MATSLKSRFDYDVFLSFRGSDCRWSLVSHLYHVLEKQGIRFFLYSKEIVVGEDVQSAIVNAITRSRIHVVIFSADYAGAKWCLEEVEEIMNQKERTKQLLVPIFYGVKSVEVMRQVKEYGEALQRHMDQGIPESKVDEWRFALSKAVCSLPKKPEDGQGVDEARLIQDIVKVISSELTKFDVFLNFRGKDVSKDVSKGFIKSLYEALTQKGIKAFIDSEKLRKGEDFPPALMDAIEQSRMYVVVLSENYAESSWCLDELVEIVKRKDKKRPMLPVFYKVKPDIVRYQTESYGEALTNHVIKYGKGPEAVKKWMDALSKASYVNGHVHDGNDDYSIPGIVEEIETILGEIGCKLE